MFYTKRSSQSNEGSLSHFPVRDHLLNRYLEAEMLTADMLDVIAGTPAELIHASENPSLAQKHTHIHTVVISYDLALYHTINRYI